MTRIRRSRALLVLLVLFLAAPPAGGQTRRSGPGDELFEAVASLDARLFDAFNSCDLEQFASFFVEDVEFYHDRGGVTRGRQALVDSIEINVCGKTRRDLVPSTLEVHPMDGYGALQIGRHRFCDPSPTPCDGSSGGVASFIHLWQRQDGAWRITRVVSYDHVPAAAR